MSYRQVVCKDFQTCFRFLRLFIHQIIKERCFICQIKRQHKAKTLVWTIRTFRVLGKDLFTSPMLKELNDIAKYQTLQ